MTAEYIQYTTKGTCSKVIGVEIENNIITNIEFIGGCQGNLKGISKLVIGMNIDEVIKRLEGIDCGGKGTSCPDQLAKCLVEFKTKQAVPQ